MADANSSGSPLETVADRIGEGTTEAFELLSNETRLAILLALWEAKDPEPPYSKPALSFSELRDWIGIRHGQNFNYHLDRLKGRYVSETDEGYTLTPRASRIVRAVLADTLADQSSFEDEPLDKDCPVCGAPVVVDYDEGGLVERCTSCEGTFGGGRLWHTDQYPAAGLDGRTPQEVRRTAETFIGHQKLSMEEGVCPICAGTVTTSLYVCEDHHAEAGAPCERCGHIAEAQTLLVCDTCKTYGHIAPNWFAHGIPAVRAFFIDHGTDVLSIEPHEVPDAEGFEVVSAEPPEVRVWFELDGDRLQVTLDEAAHVVDVTEETD